MARPINRFKGDYECLSNFFRAPVKYEGMVYDNSEAAYQAAKTTNINIRRQMLQMPPGVAKQFGQQLALREDWEEIKQKVMYDIVLAKFRDNAHLGKMLLDTGDRELIEGNTWHDNYWGDCSCGDCARITGCNELGKILMAVRAWLRGDGLQ